MLDMNSRSGKKWNLVRRRSLLDYHLNNDQGASIQGLSGFDDLRRYIKQGNEFCKELAAIMQERADVEMLYAKGLAKIATRLQKLASTCLGSLQLAWTGVATSTDQQSELHRNLSTALLEDLQKPLKLLTEAVHKSRKPIEAYVDGAMKNVINKRNDETKLKRAVFSLARETEKLYDQSLDARSGKGKMTDKDSNKPAGTSRFNLGGCYSLDKKSRGSEESLRKADKEYCEACFRAEVSRQEWHFAVHKGSYQLYKIEEQRLAQLQELLNSYNSHLSLLSPEIDQINRCMNEAIMSLDTESDINSVREQKSPNLSQTEQVLLECYAEDMSSKMNQDRRLHALNVYAYFVQMDIDKERKGQEGVEKLLEVYQNRPHFADAQAQEDVKQKLISGEAMMNFLTASQEKINTALALTNGQAVPIGQYSDYVTRSKDKQNLAVTVLRVPEHQLKEKMSSVQDYQNVPVNRAPPIGGQAACSVDDQPQYDNHDSGEDEFDYEYPESPPSPMPVTSSKCAVTSSSCHCRAIYSYEATRPDELNITEDDVISVLEKNEDGWWMGRLQGRQGLFPSTYVEEM